MQTGWILIQRKILNNSNERIGHLDLEDIRKINKF